MSQAFVPWLLGTVLALVVGVVQWHVLRALHSKRLAALRARHLAAQQSAATLLQQARQQTVQLQQALMVTRESARPRGATPPAHPVDGASARERLNRMLDDAPPSVRALPVDGFADTLPSRYFAASTTFGLLQRSSPRAM